MKRKLFTKSAFKQALECPASLYYYYDSEHYANQNSEDDFLQALAEGGQQVGDLAKVYYRIADECDIKEQGYELPLARTAELFRRENVNIAEAAFRWENCFVRADIIEKHGKHINLIEVKAKSWDDSNSFLQQDNDSLYKGIYPYVYDIAFQKYVIQKALGADYTVTVYLMMVDKRSTAPVDGMNPMFKVVNEDGLAHIERSSEAASLAGMEHVLTPFPVDDLCQRVISGETAEQRKVMSGMLFTDFVEEMSRQYVNHECHYSPLGAKCFKCPFISNHKTEGLRDGKKECWKELAHFTEKDYGRPLVADLWGQYINRDSFIRAGKYFLEDLDSGDFNTTKSKAGLNHIERKLLQIGLATGKEEMMRPFQENIHSGVYLDIPKLKQVMKDWRPPYHMIDFETSAAPIPFYKGMHPYQPVAFQFSHHIIEKDGTIRHAGQYLNTEKLHFPNYEFVRELKQQLEGDNGTVFRYAAHENTILRAIRAQLAESKEPDKESLIAFIDSITHGTRKERNGHKGERDMVDLLEIVLGYYYHPCMKGSNSIKAVLPAILNSSARLREKYAQPIYGKEIPSLNYTPEEAFSWITTNPDGTVDSPYHHLKEIASFLGVSQSELEQYDYASADQGSADDPLKEIQNGGAALAAYTKLQFSDENWTQAIAKALYRYCELDTMSMVFIWEYFHEMTGV